MDIDFNIMRSEMGHIMSGDHSGHDVAHVERVYALAMQMAEYYSLNERSKAVVASAALLHDVDDAKLFDTVNYANARHILAVSGDLDIEEDVISVISSVSFKKNGEKKAMPIEHQIVQDADRLDAIGAIGIARAFQFGGANGMPMYGGPKSVIAHFHEKLLRLKNLMNTEWAAEKAEKRTQFMLTFLSQLEREIG